MNKRWFLSTLLVCSIFLSSCNGSSTKNTVKKSSDKPKSSIVSKEVIKKDTKKKAPIYRSVYTGLKISKKQYKNIPFMAVIENSRAARPQAGLSKADIVFETMAEGGVPRFMALFYSNSPKVIGPVRSARPYFLTLSVEFNLPFAHCGGSSEALNRIKTDSTIMSMNQYAYGNYYWRDPSRYAPHNLYTSAAKLRKLIRVKNYVHKPKSSLKFSTTYWNSNKTNIKNINMRFNSYYSTSYKYKNGLYYKYMDGIASMDKLYNKPLAFKNIIIQITDISTRKDTRLNIKQTGNGKGYVLSQGKLIKINWKKSSEKSPTIITDKNGSVIKLSRGNTWWHILDSSCKLSFK
ncbi:DUF3048 domain-containing protein [Clostridium oryzae]|uniref:Putative lipoprotein YerB n=1 Tax=Clostridium oryzae TaxID=1450648 RepID=A0A1V4IN82_9CLOT|nr:DUF3048 domain-containing protein [Clostridium oryzae]OPJ61284.1 putative lipoprotein YerB precursor [Clostridium oryzae]